MYPPRIRSQIEGSPPSRSPEKFTEIQTNQGRYLRVSEHRTREGGTVGIYSDITDLKQAQEKLKKTANSDALTGLPNRNSFQERLTQAVAEGTRYQRRFAVFFFDLDHFKLINDSMGHVAGDELLISASERLRNCLRESDLIGRLGGDEFAAIVHNLGSWKDALEFAGRALKVMTPPFQIQGAEVFVSASIGIALFPQDGTDAMDLLKNADVACYHAKSQGRNNFQFFTQEMNVNADARLQLGKQLREALESERLNLHYQPQLDLNTGSITCVEALLRWNCAALNNISTQELIAFAEETGLVLAIDIWVLKQACLQNKRWQSQGLNPVCISVNLSSRLFREPELLITTVETILAETGLAPDYLAIEIKEEVIMENNDHIQAALKKISRLGIQIYLDDFGLGCSPLKALQQIHLSGLKMAISFLDQVARETDVRAMAQAIIALAHSLKIIVIAENVETEEQLDMLQACHCDQAQGYWLLETAPASVIASFLKPNSSLPVGKPG